MIVCSKRVYLNVITQLYPAELLLNANYYIPDSNSGTKTFVNNSVGTNDFGQVVRHNKTQDVDEAMGPYHIRKNDVLDINPYIIRVVVGASEDEYVDPVESYTKHINQPDTMWTVYNFLFRDQLDGNGMQFMVFEDHKTLWKYGNLICQYLAGIFGVDITFVDKACVDICEGQVQYVGNKQNALGNIKFISDYDAIMNFSQAVSQSGRFGTDANIRGHLQGMEFNELMYLYNLLYPEAPLPPGNYTEEHIRQILIGRAMDSVKGQDYGLNPNDKEALSNLMIHNWNSVLEEFGSYSDTEEQFDEYPGDDSGLF